MYFHIDLLSLLYLFNRLNKNAISVTLAEVEFTALPCQSWFSTPLTRFSPSYATHNSDYTSLTVHT